MMSPALPQDRVVFVIGAPRSGSTLLTRMLGAHSRLVARPEPHLLTPLAHLGLFDRVDRAPYDAVQSSQSLRSFVDDMPGGEEAYLDALRAFVSTLYGAHLGERSDALFVDKTPAYALILPFLEKLFPEAKFIVLTRNPFGIWDSYAASFFGGDYASAHTFNPILERYVPAIADFLRRDAVPILHVRYEDLVSDPDAVTAKLHGFLGIEHQADTVEYGDHQLEGKGLGDPLGVQQNKRPVKTGIAKWKEGAAEGDNAAFLRARLKGLDPADLKTLGYDAAELSAELDAVGTGRRTPRAWNRYLLERKVLLTLRRDIDKRPHGRIIKKIHNVCEVLLRGGQTGGWAEFADERYGRTAIEGPDA
jgi:hypothetical protein